MCLMPIDEEYLHADGLVSFHGFPRKEANLLVKDEIFWSFRVHQT